MNDKLNNIIRTLTKENKTISTMESCTGGALANKITNVIGASEVLKFSAVTYSNEFKIKMGVNREVIDKYSVYSMEVAMEMSKNISVFAHSNYGVGITGKLNRKDVRNMNGCDNVVFISIYEKDTNSFYNSELKVSKTVREDNKEEVINLVIDKLSHILECL